MVYIRPRFTYMRTIIEKYIVLAKRLEFIFIHIQYGFFNKALKAWK